jgi:hypothetical protein
VRGVDQDWPDPVQYRDATWHLHVIFLWNLTCQAPASSTARSRTA